MVQKGKHPDSDTRVADKKDRNYATANPSPAVLSLHQLELIKRCKAMVDHHLDVLNLDAARSCIARLESGLDDIKSILPKSHISRMEELGMSLLTIGKLERRGIKTCYAVSQLTEDEILAMRNGGYEMLAEIRGCVKELQTLWSGLRTT